MTSNFVNADCEDELSIDEKQMLDILRGFIAAFNAHDLDRVMDFFSDDCTLRMPRGPGPDGAVHRGRQAVRSGLASRFSGIPDVHYGEDEHWACGRNAVSKWLLTGTTVGGQKIRVRGCDLLDFDSQGKIMVKDSYWKIFE